MILAQTKDLGTPTIA